MAYLDINLLKTFIILSETQNFTHTAERIYRTQSAVSMQIAKLEEQLQCELFVRDKRNVKLTSNGLKLKEYANQIVRLSDNMLDAFSHEDVEGEINFASPEDFATYYLPTILSEFVSVHPKVKLHVSCNLTLELINEFKKGLHDLIVIKQEPGKLHKGAIPLVREELVWAGSDVAGQSLTFAKLKKKYINEYGYLPLVLSPSPCVYRERALEALDRANVLWEVTYTSPSYAGAVAAVKAGLGFTVLPRQMVPSELTCYDSSRSWPKLKQAEICLLAKDINRTEIKSLVEHIIDRIALSHTN
ncbi:MAG: LysR family transcriptional regulator [Gammaproteobacteria bacterium]|jgi:DNA-binding transcriptional LysR family regulator